MKTIIEMAREAGLERGGYWEFDLIRLKRFADLVRAEERDACAKVVVEESGRWAIPLNSTEYLQMWDECAAAIRTRGQA